MKLDDPQWQARLIVEAEARRARLIVLDPLVRMKGVGRDESAQKELDVVIEFLRELRQETEAAVCFVHHTGHTGEHMRGTSDLESVWETRLRWKRDGQSPLVDIESEHREAEAGPVVRYRIGWDALTRSMRFDADVPPTLADRILAHLHEHGPGTTDEVRAGVNVRRQDVLRTLKQLAEAGATHRGPSGRTDELGRPIRDKVWNLSNQAVLWAVPQPGRATGNESNGHRGPSRRPTSIEVGRDGRATGRATGPSMTRHLDRQGNVHCRFFEYRTPPHPAALPRKTKRNKEGDGGDRG